MAFHNNVFVRRVYAYQASSGGTGTHYAILSDSGNWRKIRAGEGSAAILAVLTAAKARGTNVDVNTDSAGHIYKVYWGG